jgi:hypothetical protein
MSTPPKHTLFAFRQRAQTPCFCAYLIVRLHEFAGAASSRAPQPATEHTALSCAALACTPA